jgi:hypothetical protein
MWHMHYSQLSISRFEKISIEKNYYISLNIGLLNKFEKPNQARHAWAVAYLGGGIVPCPPLADEKSFDGLEDRWKGQVDGRMAPLLDGSGLRIGENWRK